MTTRIGHSSSARRARRAGATLVELLVTMVLLGIVMSAVFGVLNRQQSALGAVRAGNDLRMQLAQGAMILPSDLRGISVASTTGGTPTPDILNDSLVQGDKSLLIRAAIGSGVICAVAGGSFTLVPVGTLSSGAKLTSYASLPMAGDSMYVFNATAGTWIPYGVATFQPNGSQTCPTAVVGGRQPFLSTSAADVARRSINVTLSGGATLDAAIGVGAPVRFVRRVRYGMVQGSGGKWYLGYCPSLCTKNSTLQPLLGPIRAAGTNPATNGFAVYYYDSTGKQIASPSAASLFPRVRRMDVVVRGRVANISKTGNLAKTDSLTDSLRFSVALRNWQ